MNYLMKIRKDFGVKRDYAVVPIQNNFKLNLHAIMHCVETDKEPLRIVGQIEKKYIHYIYTLSKEPGEKILIKLQNTFEGFLAGGNYVELIFNPGSILQVDSLYGKIFAYRVRNRLNDSKFNPEPEIEFKEYGVFCNIFEEVPFSLESSLHRLHHDKKEAHKNIVYSLYTKERVAEIQKEIANLQFELENIENVEILYSGKVAM